MLLLEVKSSKDRGFIVSAGEAERHRDEYSFLVVLRGTDRLNAMELLPDPAALLEAGQLSRAEDGWVVTYAVP